MMPIKHVLPPYVTLACLLDKLRPLCWGAADILLAYAKGEKPPYGFPPVLEFEEGGEGPVSVADLAVNTWLLDGLQSAFPKADWTLISEESVKNQLIPGKPLKSDWLWILDPLDGTKDFLEGSTDYAVHLALVHFNRPVLGIVLIPELEELWFGVLGTGAWCENRQGIRSEVCFAESKKINEMIVASSRNHKDERLMNLINGIGVGGMRSIGSVGCKVATILRGETDFYISLSGKSAPKDWDMAAPEAVLRAAGGSFTHADGRQLRYNKSTPAQHGCLIASHGNLHSEICLKSLNYMNLSEPEFEV